MYYTRWVPDVISIGYDPYDGYAPWNLYPYSWPPPPSNPGIPGVSDGWYMTTGDTSGELRVKRKDIDSVIFRPKRQRAVYLYDEPDLYEQIESLRLEVEKLEQELAAVPVVDIHNLLDAVEYAWVVSPHWSDVGGRIQAWLGKVLLRPNGGGE